MLVFWSIFTNVSSDIENQDNQKDACVLDLFERNMSSDS